LGPKFRFATNLARALMFSGRKKFETRKCSRCVIFLFD
jgi:hypothetical protein